MTLNLGHANTTSIEEKPVVSANDLVVPRSANDPLKPDAKKALDDEAQFNAAFKTPILFYGKVVDENGVPIAQATAIVSFATSPDPNVTPPHVETTSDSSGLFSAEGKGLGVVVKVSKEGYYKQKQSRGTFNYVDMGSFFDPHPNPENPAIFVLRKMGAIQQLTMKVFGGRVPKNGEPLSFDLLSGSQVPDGKGDFKIECWTEDSQITPNSGKQFTWLVKISSPQGLLERKDKYDFVAPTEGYQISDEISMPMDLENGWKNSLTKEYFIKRADGTYARIKFMMNAGGEQVFNLTSYVNPVPGAQSLESGTERQ